MPCGSTAPQQVVGEKCGLTPATASPWRLPIAGLRVIRYRTPSFSDSPSPADESELAQA
jgi:hypothetical protein